MKTKLLSIISKHCIIYEVSHTRHKIKMVLWCSTNNDTDIISWFVNMLFVKVISLWMYFYLFSYMMILLVVRFAWNNRIFITKWRLRIWVMICIVIIWWCHKLLVHYKIYDTRFASTFLCILNKIINLRL